MASHKDSEEFKKHTVLVKSLGDEYGGGKKFSENAPNLVAGDSTYATVFNKKKCKQLL